MDIRKLVTEEQFKNALNEVAEENWKVKALIGELDEDKEKGYDNFPEQLKGMLDKLILEKLKPIIRNDKIDDILDE